MDAVLRRPGNVAARGEIDGQLEIVGEIACFLHQNGLDLDPAGVEIEHRRQARNHPEAAPPLAELPAPRQT